MIIENLLYNLNNLDLEEVEPNTPEEIIKSVLEEKTDYQKGEIFIKVAEHHQASIWTIKELMWQYYSGKIKDANIIDDNLNRLHKTLDKKENRTKTQQLEQCKMVLDELSTGPSLALFG